MNLYTTSGQHCAECGETLEGPENYGSDARPLCMLCSALARVERAEAAGLTVEEIAALSQVLVRTTRARYAALLHGGRQEEAL